VLLEDLPEIGNLDGEILAVLGGAVQGSEQLPRLSIVLNCLEGELLRSSMLLQNGEQVLLFESRQELKLDLELGEQPIPGLDGGVGGICELREQFVRLHRACLD
jgi:hypothetical protein